MNRLEREMRSEHDAAFESLPWFVNGTLQGAELQRVERHLNSCVVCRGELAYQRTLAQSLAASEDFPLSSERGFLELRDRIDLEESSTSRRGIANARWLTGLRRSWQHLTPGVRATLFAQAAVILLLVGLAATGIVSRIDRNESEPEYRTLSDVVAPVADSRLNLHLVFVPDTPEIEMRSLLARIGGEIVAGPSPLGVYTVATTLPEDGSVTLEALLTQLRGHDSVVFAEPASPRGSGASLEGSADPEASLPTRL
jgi:hypothetical protein